MLRVLSFEIRVIIDVWPNLPEQVGLQRAGYNRHIIKLHNFGHFVRSNHNTDLLIICRRRNPLNRKLGVRMLLDQLLYLTLLRDFSNLNESHTDRIRPILGRIVIIRAAIAAAACHQNDTHCTCTYSRKPTLCYHCYDLLFFVRTYSQSLSLNPLLIRA
ncbi:hypothetical protein D3C78_1206730 [compost metagenome]